MKNTLLLKIGFIVLFLFAQSLIYAQQQQCRCNDYLIQEFSTSVSHNQIKALLDNQCGNLGMDSSGRLYTCPDEGDKIIAGLGFVVVGAKNSSCLNESEAIRIILILWEPTPGAPAMVCENFSVAGYPVMEDAFNCFSEGVASRTLEIGIDTKGQTLALSPGTEEFEFVFLGFNRYLYLATGVDFYKTGSRPLMIPQSQWPGVKEGITIHRSVSNLYQFENGTGSINSYASLWFTPNPDPRILPSNYPDLPTKAAIAYEEGKYCPPYWEEDPRKTLCEITSSELEEILALESIDGSSLSDIPKPKPDIGISAYVGIPLNRIENFSATDLFYEFEVEFELKQLKALIDPRGKAEYGAGVLMGIYPFAQDSDYFGLSLLAKAQYPFDEKLSIYVNAGPGLFFVPSSTDFQKIDEQIGLTTGLGLSYYFARKYRVELGAQFQNLNLPEPNNNPGWAIKAGLKRNF